MKNPSSNNIVNSGTTFYPEDPLKLAIFSLLTGGMYGFLWTYRHWRHFKRRALEEKKTFNNKDKDIKPYISAFFAPIYIIGIARRIRDKFKDFYLQNYRTGPWWAFYFCLIGIGAGGRIEKAASLELVTTSVLLTTHLLVLVVFCWQFLRLQLKANQYIISSGEMNAIPRVLSFWDWIVLTIGLLSEFAFLAALVQ